MDAGIKADVTMDVTQILGGPSIRTLPRIEDVLAVDFLLEDLEGEHQLVAVKVIFTVTLDHLLLDLFLEGAQAKVDAAYGEGENELTFMRGKRYVRVISNAHGSRSAFCFVDRETGDVLKPAGWKGPAKHARGNIYDADHGAGGVTAYGAAYLR